VAVVAIQYSGGTVVEVVVAFGSNGSSRRSGRNVVAVVAKVEVE